MALQYYVLLLVIGLSLGENLLQPQKPCGGNLTEPKGILNTPNFPYDVAPNTTCKWEFKLKNSTADVWVYLYFTDFNLAEGDVVEISYPENGTNITGRQGPFLILLRQFTVVTFKASNKTAVGRHFKATYSSKECKFSLRDIVGTLKFPKLNTTKNGSIDCTWILTSEPVALSATVLSFTAFNLPNQSHVTIYNGSGTETQLKNYSGSVLPDDVIGGSQLTVILHLELPVSAVEFNARFASTTPECTKTLDATDAVSLSPPKNIFEPVNCIWILESKPNTTFMVGFNSLKLNNVKDILLINDGASLYSPNMKTFVHSSSKTDGIHEMTTKNRMYISFSSDQSISASDFDLEVVVQSLGGRFRKNGTFGLPANSTLSNTTVVFLLTVDPDEQIEVTINKNLLRPSNRILFYDVATDNDKETLLGTFTSSTPFYTVFSQGNNMRVEAKYFQGPEFFEASFWGTQKGCDVIDNGLTGSYQQAGKMQGPCTWLIQPSNTVGLISLTVTVSQHIGFANVQVYSGMANVSIKLVQEFNTSSSFQHTILVPAKYGARVETTRLQSYQGNSSWFSGSYELQPACSNVVTLTSGSKVNISNLGYPYQYPFNANCSWQLVIPFKKHVRLQFTQVNLYNEDTLKVYSVKNGSLKNVTALRGAVKKMDDLILDDTEEVIVTWLSIGGTAEMLPQAGFFVEVEVLDFGGNITSDSATVSTPTNVNGTSVVCTWSFTVPAKSGSDINNIKFQVAGGHTKSNSSLLKFYDGGSLQSPKITPPLNNTPVFSRTNKLMVSYQLEANHSIQVPYNITVSVHGCDSKHQCTNGICMQDGWRCNGKNDCGDFSDEENCSSSGYVESGISAAWLTVAIATSLVIGIALALLVPVCYRKLHDVRQRYHDFRILAEE